MRALAVALALVLLAGCGSPAAKPAASDDVPTETVRTDSGDVVRVDLGALRGRVHDEVNYSLAGARISVLGTDAFAKSGLDGTFRIVNLTAGEHEIQVLASEFHPNRQTVTIQPGQTTVVDLLLLPLQPRSGGYQPHAHDMWRGMDMYLLMDGEFDPSTPTPRDTAYHAVTSQLVGPTTNNTRYRIPLPESEPDHPSIVLPGTKEIRITLDWDAATQTLPDLGVSYDTPEEKMYIPGFRAKDLSAKPPGQVHTINVAPEWQDNGHALWTDWRFFVHFDNDPATEGTDYRLGVMVGIIHVKIELVRGQVVLDPPHTDWWQENSTIHVSGQATKGITFASGPAIVSLPTDSIIPPGTARMRFEMTWEPNLVPQAPELAVAVLTADQHPEMTPLSAMRRFDTLEQEAGRIIVETDVERTWPDPYYATSSGWKWYLYFDTPQPNSYTWPDSMQINLDITLWKETT